MKKTILSLALALVALAVSAQRPLEANQRLVGYYTSDDIDNSLSFTSAPGKMQAGAYLVPNDYVQYVGAKVVGMRFALGSDGTSTGVAVYSVNKQSTYTQLVAVDAENKEPGWHTVMFPEDKQFTLSDQWKAVVPSFKYTQTRSNSPVAVYAAGPKRDLYIYGKIPNSAGGTGREEWNNLGGDYGSVAIQLIVETNGAAQNAVTPQDFGTYRVGLGQTKTVDVTFNNFGGSLKNLDYTVTMDDKTSDEYHIDLTETDNALTGTGTVTVPVVLPAASAMGTYPVTLTVTKVNGEENQAARKEASGTCMTVFKDFVQKVFVEEMTGTGCGWCPRGIVGMQLMKQKYGDRFVGVAIHRYNASTDPMAPREYLTLDDLPAGNAPLCIINRNGNQAVDPYFGSSGEKFGISRDIEKELYYGTAEVGVTVSGVWNADQTEVTATAVVEANIAGDFDVAFILVADSVVGDNAAWYQNNNYAQYDPADGGYAADPNLAQFCKGGTYGVSQIKQYPFEDVVIASSYNTRSTLATLDPVSAGGTVYSTYTLKLPTKNTLKPYINKDKVSVVAVLTEKSTGYVLNVDRNEHITPLTGIVDAAQATGETVEVARYNAAGQRISAPQKGLNIVKLADGRTLKVIVK